MALSRERPAVDSRCSKDQHAELHSFKILRYYVIIWKSFPLLNLFRYIIIVFIETKTENYLQLFKLTFPFKFSENIMNLKSLLYSLRIRFSILLKSILGFHIILL